MGFKSKTRKLFSKKKKSKSYHHLYLYVIIVNFGFSDMVIDVLEQNNSNMHLTIAGKGTASKETLRVLGLEDTRKDVILAFIDEKELNNITDDLNELFLQKKKFLGMGYSIKVTSIVGEKIYHFLSNTI